MPEPSQKVWVPPPDALPIQRAIVARANELGITRSDIMEHLGWTPTMTYSRTVMSPKRRIGHLCDIAAALGCEIVLKEIEA